MKLFSKILTVLLALACCFPLAGCNEDESKTCLHEYEWTTVTEPICTEGVQYGICKKCSYECERRLSAQHQYTWTVEKPATCSELGYAKGVCTICDPTGKNPIGKPIATNSHDYGEGEVTLEPTCTKTGTKKYTCSFCKIEKHEQIPALKHDFVGGVCSRCSAVE